MEMQFPVILDGATGTELQKRGFTGDMSAEQWVLEHPESILEIQRKYVASGSNVLYAPTFGGNRQKLEERGIFNRVVAVSADQIVDYDINVALAMHKTIDTKMIDVANTISI